MKARNLNYILGTVIIILIIFLVTCNGKKKDPNAPKVTTTTEYRNKIIVDSAALQRNTDSIRRTEVNPALAKADYWYSKFKTEEKNAILQGDFLTDVINKDCPDTSGRIKAELTRYKVANKKAIDACDSTVKEKNKAIAGQVAINKLDSSALEVMRSDFRRALRTQDTLQAYIDKVQPRRSLYVGITFLGNPQDFFTGFGPNLGYENKKGLKVEGGMLFMQNLKVKQFTVGFKKTILIL